jgi:hypothetical protein
MNVYSIPPKGRIGMAARAEHLVSYQTTTLRMREIEEEIANVDRALTAVVTSSQIGNLRTGRNTLEWLAIVRRS